MATIPEYQRRKLASSVVGTPGVDTSGQQIFNTISQSTAKVADVFGSIAVERQQVKDEALANKKLIEFEMNMARVTDEHQAAYSEFRGDKTERVNAFRTRAEELFKSTADSIPSRGARQLFDRQGLGVVRGSVGRELTIADRNQAALALADGTESANLLAGQASALGLSQADVSAKRAGLQKLLSDGVRTYQTTSKVLGDEEKAKLKAAIPEMISKGFLVSSMDRNPETVIEMLNDGTFDAILTAEDKQKYLKDAREALPKVKEIREIDALVAEIPNHQALWDKYINKDASLYSDIEQSNTPFAKSLRNLAIKGDPDPIMQAATVLDLEAKFLNITKKKEGKEVSKRVQLEALNQFMNDVVEARSNGAISTDVANSYLKKLANPLYDKVKVEHQQGIMPSFGLNSAALTLLNPVYAVGAATIDSFFSKNNRVTDIDAKSKVVVKYLQRYDASKVKTPADADTLAREVVREQVQEEVPGLGLIAGSPNKILRFDTSQTFVQGGASDVKDAAKVPPRGMYTVVVPNKKDNLPYRLTYNNGKLVKAEKVVSDAAR